MYTAFAETVPTSTDSGNMFIGYLGLIAIILFFIYRKRKKAGKPFIPAALINKIKGSGQKNTSPIVTKTGATSPAKKNDKWYGDDPTLMSIARFQKVVYRRFVVFDLETTGFDADIDKIVEIGAVRVENGEITGRYQQLVNPGVSIPSEVSDMNHITDATVKGCPSIRQVLPDFLDFVGDDALAAHNAGFDAAFLRAACSECGLKAPKDFFDTMRLSVYWPHLKNRKLETFLKAAGIKNDNSHRSLSDAEATANLIIMSFDKLK